MIRSVKSMNAQSAKSGSRMLLLAPFIFVCHFLEEAPGFVDWFNSRVARGITPETFWRVNTSGLVITLIVVGLELFSRSSISLTLVTGWLAFLMLANAILHITGALVDKQYVPGLVTAVMLYIPYFLWFFLKATKGARVGTPILFGAAVIGSIPML